MEKQTRGSDFQKYLLEYLYNNSYKEIKYDELARDLSSQMNIGMSGFISDWYNTKGLPAFGLGDIKAYEVIGESQVVYLVNTKVTNFSNVSGLVKFTFMMGEGGGPRGFRGGGGPQTEPVVRTYLINANETKEVQIILSESPRSLIFNTLIAENIPSKTMIFNILTLKDPKMKAEEFEKVVDQPATIFSPEELIVDNSDKGFSIKDPAQDNYFHKLFAKKNKSEEDKFVGQGFGPAPAVWSLAANSDYFGKTEHSAMVVRSGDGNKTATWKKALPGPGYYDVYVWLTEQRRYGPGRDRSEPEGKYQYTVKHDDGVEKIEIERKDFEKGWNLLGSFYLSSDTATVTLSDAGGADRVVADAVKWVLQR
jgi:hypothetical protein